MTLTATATRAQLSDRTLNPSRTVAPAVGTNMGGQVVHLALVMQGVAFLAEDLYDAIAAKYDTAAALTTALTGANNDLVFTARKAGKAGESITVAYVDPAANSQALSVAVVGNAITVNLATDGGGAITSTGATVLAAINGSATASALVFASLAAANSGAGVVTAMVAAALAGSGGKVFSDKDYLSEGCYQLRVTA